MSETYYINCFIPVTIKENEVFFGITMGKSSQKHKFHFIEKQKEIIKKLIAGESFSKEELIEYLGEDTVNYFIKNKIILNHTQDTQSICSRTNAYFNMHLNSRALNKLKKSTVLLLGCGGIGTHVAWNLTTIGIGKIVLLDFDKIELSNLNRQLLFDVNDVGKSKVEVLKNKLRNINPMIEIETINTKITSEKVLKDIFLKYPSDLIIKTLDSPTEFPMWIDSLCSKLKINYIAGITSGMFSLIGPTYIAGFSHGYSDFFDSIKQYEIVSGIAPSISIQQSYCGSEISNEALKLLTMMDLRTLKYINKIHYIDIIRNVEMDMIPKDAFIEADIDYKEGIRKNILMVSLIFIISVLLTNWNALFWIGACFLIIAPLFLYKTSKYISMSVFINLSWYMLIGIISLIVKNHHLSDNMSFYTIISSITVLFIFFSLIIFVGTVISRGMFEFKVSIGKMFSGGK
ncbi:ThiF family adenylyltransferase [Clostridium grantii]|uniref:Molybdopterin or thiamine biosynthesis adenylyltransferase n=1 Tax=Clostridium grantii DSM 8605 TaxID=1121316 RepID=A0A1M5VFW3_9CLOT|nr:ThiF family adenylyltransferase [Clostridium grantii]SHH74137.1 Molybdopterin or thiamine biosynthesis adenylyltransferase [Clostridium grantii DSM 8605]